jgi:nucleosome binding factor SPN SPT16 subunit
MAKYKGSKDGKSGGEGKTWKKFESYRREDQLPAAVKNKRVSPKVLSDAIPETGLMYYYGFTLRRSTSTK